MLEEIFNKILNNSATEAEKNTFYKSLEADSARCEIFYQYKNLYAVSNCISNKSISLQRDSFERFWSHVKPVKSSRIVKMWYRYAAIFVIALSLGFAMQYLVPDRKDIKAFAQKIEIDQKKDLFQPSISTMVLQSV
jgi:hypothetical protein